MFYHLKTVRGEIPYTESANCKETWDGLATEATRTCYVPWDKRLDFQKAILPLASVGGPALDAVGVAMKDPIYLMSRNLAGTVFVNHELERRQILRRDPERHPVMTWLHAVKAEVTGVGVAKAHPDGTIAFRDNTVPDIVGLGDQEGVAQIVVTYRKLPFRIGVSDYHANPISFVLAPPPISGDVAPSDYGYELVRYVSVEWKPASDTFTIPSTKMQEFTGGPGSVIAESLSKIVNKTHIVYTWHMVPGMPIAAGLLRGHVHGIDGARNIFDATHVGLIEGTSERWTGDVLYLYPEIGDPYPLCDGTPVRDIKYHCIYRRPGSNWVFRPSLITRGILPVEIPARYAGWTVAFRRDAAAGVVGMTWPHNPGNTLHPYGNLHSLFGLYVDAPPAGPGASDTGGSP